ncbi:MAG: phosphotransferase family protein [Chloroflexi bacterium]|nr:phosphotransferase family protein [Chloroflexota bacterium]MDL1885066.1 phosphotransferase family protein [Anaerolineae bacterium CFX8]
MRTPTDFRQRITEYLEAVTGGVVEIKSLQPLAGGASRDTWLIHIHTPAVDERLVLRRDLPTSIMDSALERDQEFAIMSAAHVAGVRVPQPRWFCSEPHILGEPFLIYNYIEGVSIGAEVVSLPELAEARRRLPEQMGEQLARIHRLNPALFDFLPRPRPGYSPAQEAVLQTRAALIRLGVHNPALAFGLRWIERHLPEGGEVVFLHGDFRVGNFIVSEEGLSGIVDWEFSRLGDPCEELAWPCLRDWRYGSGHLRLGGIGEREPFIRAYERASGRRINRKVVDFWEILGNLRWAVTALAQANRHLALGETSVELASLGRRSAEMQLEMLRLIAEQGV